MSSTVLNVDGFSAVDDMRPFEALLSDRSTARKALDAALAAPRRAAAFAIRMYHSLGAGRLVARFRDGTSWVLGVLRTAGPGNVAVLTATTPRGRRTVTTVLRMTVRALGWPLRLALAPFTFAARHTGAPGRTVAVWATVVFCAARDRMVGTYTRGVDWLAAHDDNKIVVLLRITCRASLIRRLIVRFVPQVGWMRICAYTGAVLLTPGESGWKAITKSLEDAGEVVQRAADSLKGTPEGDVTVKVRADGLSAFDDGKPFHADPQAVDVVCQRAGNTGEITVRVHTMTDGSKVFQVGRQLFVGRLPAGLDPAHTAEAVATAAQAVADATTPTNRAERRILGERGPRRGGAAAATG